MEDTLYFELTILVVLLITCRFFYLIHKITTGNSAQAATTRSSPAKTVICIGSGGHTTEILQLVQQLDFKNYSPRFYVVAKSDTTSRSKILQVEQRKPEGEHRVVSIPRSRIVGQSYVTSVFTTLYSVVYSIPVVLRIRPDLILCNGPGTCIPICIIAFVLKAAFVCDTRIVFIESFCRTKTFSLTAKILFYIADNIVVQWPSLKCKSKRVTYIGQLM